MLEVGGSIPSPPTNAPLQLRYSDCYPDLRVFYIWSFVGMQALQHSDVVP